jgi:predicted CopG family antitoxin
MHYMYTYKYRQKYVFIRAILVYISQMRKSTILIQSVTREKLKQIGRKGESYDDLINQLLLQKKKLSSLDDRIETLESSESGP